MFDLFWPQWNEQFGCKISDDRVVASIFFQIFQHSHSRFFTDTVHVLTETYFLPNYAYLLFISTQEGGNHSRFIMFLGGRTLVKLNTDVRNPQPEVFVQGSYKWGAGMSLRYFLFFFKVSCFGSLFFWNTYSCMHVYSKLKIVVSRGVPIAQLVEHAPHVQMFASSQA